MEGTEISSDGMDVVTERIMTHTMKDGRTVVLSSLTLKDWVAAREKALEEFKREKIKTWTANADLIPEANRNKWIQDAFKRAEGLSYGNLPKKSVNVPAENGSPETQQTVEYELWWMSETASGKLFMTWLSLVKKQPDMTIDDADRLFMEDAADLEAAAQKVGSLSQPRIAKNSGSPPATEGKKERRRKRRR